MKQQVLVIHGGDLFETHKEYIRDLKKAKLDLDRIRKVGWKQNLAKKLGKNFDVLLPKMPNDWNARYEEWNIWFKKIVPLLDKNVILVGHSLGGMFLAKYLSENLFPKKIKATFLIAASYNMDGKVWLGDFTLKKSLTKFKRQAGKIYLFHSKDDMVVPFTDFGKYQKDIPQAETRIFANRGHFNQENFPELINEIRQLTK
jgi:predicted alpha/beta hydrolase family esterase